ncbi:lantibiotic dehydratase [Streptomyces radicis]|uniref:Lantibiotic dehydratase n=1 Tax=Streptomyces radicis TaxID=1750517 RepID=A0A3A9WF54_9ACTN|nr:lantibiotic dehydratase [Streptomyces radicis]RKN06296.1 lantibiotic dehydratase [Streptomyces radicis]RKN18626.1 lantibiotic dehydratase [Streptomyces radicis]
MNGGGGAEGWELGPRFVARIAGLPVDAVRRLRAPGARRWADEVLDEGERLAAAGGRVGDLLHGLVGGLDDERARRALLRLRRAVFNNRLPADPAAASALVHRLDRAAGEALDAWLEGRGRLAEREAAGEALLAAQGERARGELRRLAAGRRLRDGLLLASPALDAQLDGWLAAPPGGGDKRARKIERSLLAYVYRTACKTSPFSSFTGVAPGTFARGAGQGPGELRSSGPWVSHPRLNVLALGRIAEAIVADPARRADLPVAPASGWGRDEDRVRYVRRWVTAGDDDTAVTFDAVRDRLFFLRRSGALDRMLDFFDTRPEARYGELAAWLARALDAPEAEVEEYLAALLHVGMVRVPTLTVGVHDTDPLRALGRSLRALGRDWADRTAAALEGPLACLARYPAAEPEERRALLAELRDRLAAIQRDLGEERPRVPRTVLYEDVVAPAVTADRERWDEVLAGPLRAIERVLPAFDLTLPQRLTFKGFFLARHGIGGRCDDLLRLIDDFHEDFFDQYLSFAARRKTFDAAGEYVPEENWLGLPQLKALDAARSAFIAGMRARWAARAAPTGGDPGELALDDALLAETAAELAGLEQGPRPHAHHVQLAERRGGGPLVVLNRSYGGLSFPFSRFTHCLDPGLPGALRERAARLRPEGAVFAEVTGGPVTSNLNLHARLTDWEIVCPGETSGAPPERRIRLDELVIEHDQAADRLALRAPRLGVEVIPVYLGYLVPLALPEVPRTLLLLSPTSMAPLDVWGGVPEGEPHRGVTRRPRVTHGRLVLARRSWSAPATALPLRGRGVGEAEWFLGWHRWRREQGVPDRVFATVADSGQRGATGAKPHHVDFDSPLSLAAFEGLLKDAGARVVLREALPDEHDPGTAADDGGHVTELAVETATPARPQAEGDTP